MLGAILRTRKGVFTAKGITEPLPSFLLPTTVNPSRAEYPISSTFIFALFVEEISVMSKHSDFTKFFEW